MLADIAEKLPRIFKRASRQAPSLPGDSDQSADTQDEIQRARQDFLLACLEAAKDGSGTAPAPEILPAQPELELIQPARPVVTDKLLERVITDLVDADIAAGAACPSASPPPSHPTRRQA